MPKKKYLIFHVLVIGTFFSGLSQTREIALLRLNVNQSKTAEQKINALLALCDKRVSLNTDSLIAYAAKARQLALQLSNPLFVNKANFYTAAGMLRNIKYDSAINICNENIQELQKNNLDNRLLIEFKNLKAQTLIRSTKFKEALGLLYGILHDAEVINDTLLQIKIKSNIGWLQMDLTQYKESVIWFKKAINTTKNEALLESYPPVYCTLGSSYNNLSLFDSALYFVNKGIAGAKKNQQLSFLANGLNIRADVYLGTNRNALAEADLNEALTYRKLLGDPFYIVSDMTQISNFYAVTGNYKKGIDIANQGLEMANKYNMTAKYRMLYLALGENYERSGDYKNYSRVLKKVIDAKDSIYENNTAESLADLQTKYEVQKKENIIIQQKLDIVNKDNRFLLTLALFAFAGTLGFILYKNYQKREKLKLDKLVEEQRLKETIAVLKAEERERKRIAADLHDNLGAYAAAISSNVRSVKESGAIKDENLTQRLEENAQDMVNELGNTIWVLKKETQQLTEISDRLKLWLQKLIVNYPEIEYDFNENFETDTTLSPTHALHLYHILQECINNALRHSGGNMIMVHFESNDTWEITVGDNGNGFMMNKVHLGNGILNLQERAANCGFEIIWQNEHGTLVRIRPK